MADIKISALPTLAGASVAVGDSFPIVDASAVATKRITLAELALSFANVTSFKVPDATADGQPIAYDQSGASVRNFTLASTTPFLVINDTDGTADLSRYAFRINSDQWELISQNDAGSTQAILLRASANSNNIETHKFGTAGSVDFSSSASVVVPAATAATHAARVSAIDATTGRLAIGGIEMGDTGWRDLSKWDASGTYDLTGGKVALESSFAPNGTDAGYFSVRRIGNTVMFRGLHIYANASLSADTLYTLFLTSPAGFVPDSNYGPWPPISTSGLSKIKSYGSFGSQRLILGSAATSGQAVLGTTPSGGALVSPGFLCTQAWPSSLPGTAA